MDLEMLLQDADEFRRLTDEIMAATKMSKESAERAVIFSGHRQIELELDTLLELFSGYIQARGDNSAQLQGLISKVLKSRNKK